jgi:hypothetical protein
LQESFDEFGFSLSLDRGADVQTAGWILPEPSAQQGLLSFSTGGVNVILTWLPPAGNTALTMVGDTYDIVTAQQPGLIFETIRDGGITVGGQTGVFGGFRTSGASGTAVGGGIIGSWICPEPDTGFSLTVTGADATIVQIRFDRLIDNFACPG